MASFTGLLDLQYACMVKKFEDNILTYIPTNDGILFDIDEFNNLRIYHQILFHSYIINNYDRHIKLKKQLKKCFNIVKKTILNNLSILIYKLFYANKNNVAFENDSEKIKLNKRYLNLIKIKTHISNHRL